MNKEDFELDPSNEDRISLEASAWIAKRDEGFRGEDQDAFFEWLSLDPKHREIYNERLAFWEEMNGLSDWRPELSREPNPDLLACRKASRWKGRILTLSAIAASLVLGMFIFYHWAHFDRNEARVLAFGGAQSYENHVLDDGSIVELNRGAEVSVQYSRDKRLIFLHAGEAHFMVAKSSERPFQVRAGDALVQATGTAFNVALDEKGIEVLVTEGRVLVDAALPLSDKDDTRLAARPAHELVAGQRSLVLGLAEAEPLEINSISSEEIDRRLAWKAEDLDFTAVPLFKVADEFNRRNRVKIGIGDSDLRDLPITAKLRSNNLDGFVELLEVAMDVRAVREEEYKITLRKSDAL